MKELELIEAICRGIDPRDGSILDTRRDPIWTRQGLPIFVDSDSSSSAESPACTHSRPKPSQSQNPNSTEAAQRVSERFRGICSGRACEP